MATRLPDLLDPDDELGQVAAAQPPTALAPSDPYIVDENYDETFADLDPDKMGHH